MADPAEGPWGPGPQMEKARGLREKGYGKPPNSTKALRALTIQDGEMKKVGSFRRY